MKNLYEIQEVESCLSHKDPMYPHYPHGGANEMLGHSNSLTNPDRTCDKFDSTDIVHCFYLFGETLIEQEHPYGKCPWKLIFEEGYSK